MKHQIAIIVFFFLCVIPVAGQDALCTNGTLLYREDFGGNDPDDPPVSTSPVQGMSSDYTNGRGQRMGNKVYTITKKGYRNGIQWHLQDDHTYPNDYSRGYFLEVDGGRGSDPFYGITIDGLCAGSKMTFSAYVVNITFAGQIPYLKERFNYAYPRLRFVLQDIETEQELASKSTGDILPDTTKEWNVDLSESAEWQLVGMNFTVPEGVNSVKMFIYNDVTSGGQGNDFALDDIEVHLCAPPVHITSPHMVCEGRKYNFKIDFRNNGALAEPLEYQWFYAPHTDTENPPDEDAWTPVDTPEGKDKEMGWINTDESRSGWYKVIVAGEGNLNNPNCRTVSEPFLLRVNPDCPVCTDGRLLFTQDMSDPTPAGWSYTIDGLCAGTELSLLANTADERMSSDARVTMIVQNAGTQEELKRYTADYTELDEWHYAGYNFAVPETVSSVTITVLTEGLVSMAQFEAYLCAPSVSIVSQETVCRDDPYAFAFRISNGTNDRLAFAEPYEYQWYHSYDQEAWEPVANTRELTIDSITDSDRGWYKVRIAEQGNIANDYCRVESEQFELHIFKCLKPPQAQDTTVCDTLMPYTWHGIEWLQPGDSIQMLHYTTGEDSLEMTWHLRNMHCCPELDSFLNYRHLEAHMCDTLMPYHWTFRDTVLVFYDISDTHEYIVPHAKWHDCPDTVYTFKMDTFHCERLYPIAVNKYNRVLLCDHVMLAQLFPETTPTAYQWYFGLEPIRDATDDDYSEMRELHGSYQLRVQLDGKRYVWSERIEIADTNKAPVRVRIYNSQGTFLKEETLSGEDPLPSLPHGIWLLYFEQGDDRWSEKKLVL